MGSRPVSRVLSRAIIPLGPVSPRASSGLPGSARGSTLPLEMLAHLGPLPYLVLLQVGFTMPALLPRTRCALTAPFHPYRLLQLAPQQLRRFALCCTFRRLAPPRRYLAPDPPEPGLSSTPDVAARSSDHLAGSPPPTIRGCARKSIFRVREPPEASVVARGVFQRGIIDLAAGRKRIRFVSRCASELCGDRRGPARW